MGAVQRMRTERLVIVPRYVAAWGRAVQGLRARIARSLRQRPERFMLVGLIAECACGARSDLGAGGSAEEPTVAGGHPAHSGEGASGGSGGFGAASCVPATSDSFDPREVYFIGTTAPSSSSNDVVAHWCDSEIGVAGFDFGASGFAIRPTDGRLIRYEISPNGFFEFHCDTCPFTSATPYPEDSWLNDIPIPTPGCDQVRGILMSPEGEIVTQCGDDPPIYLSSAGDVLYPAADSVDPILLHIGSGGVGLTESFVVDLSTGVSTPIVGLPEGLRGAARAAEDDGFWVTRAHEGVMSLFHITGGGTATLVGDYSPPPSSVFVSEDLAWLGALDAEHRFFEVGEYLGESVILRRDLSGVSEVVHDDGADPLIKLGGWMLVTGP